MINPDGSGNCMVCGNVAKDAAETDPDGTFWVYCRKCDCWTEHPPEDRSYKPREIGDPPHRPHY